MYNLDELISQKISSFNLKVGQAFEFYNIIGNEDKKEIYKMINDEENDENDENDEDDENDEFMQNNQDDNDDNDDIFVHHKKRKNSDF